MIVSGTIPNFIQGVSQQPERERLDGQGWAQENFRSSALDGLVRRPGTVIKHKLPFTLSAVAAEHAYRRGDSEAYRIYVDGGAVKVIDDNTGIQKTVNMGPYAGYLTTPDPGVDILFTTIGDVTLIASRRKVVAASATRTPARKNWGMVFVKHGNYASTYTVTVDGHTGSYQTPDGSQASHREKIATNYIANQLAAALLAALPAGQYATTLYGSVVVVTRNDSTPMVMSSGDGNGGSDMAVIYDAVEDYGELPPWSAIGYLCQVVGSDTNRRNGSWFKFVGDNLWEEAPGPSQSIGLDPLTMPHVLLRLSDGTFKFGPAIAGLSADFPTVKWATREAGDDDSNPMPSFVGYTINAMGSVQNRLYILADENFIASRTADFFAFFKKSSASVAADDDPIDIASSENEVSELLAATGFNKTLVLWSTRSQFVIDCTKPITPTNISLPVASSYECDASARPVAAGSSIFFPTVYGEYTGIKEYFVEATSIGVNRADSITSHVPRYIKGRPRKLAATTNFDILAVLSDDERDALYVYEYLWSGDKKVLASWSRWKLPEGTYIINISMIDSSIIMTVLRGTVSMVLEMDFSMPDQFGVGFPLALDAMRELTTYLGPDGDVLVDIPPSDTLRLSTDGPCTLVYGGDHKYKGMLVGSLVHVSGDTYRVQGESAAPPFKLVCGIPFKSVYEITTPRVKDRDKVIMEGTRTTLQKFIFQYADTGSFDVVITKGDAEHRYKFRGNRIGLRSLRIGQVNLQSGPLSVPVRAHVDAFRARFEAEDHTPCKILHAQWDATFRGRGTRV